MKINSPTTSPRTGNGKAITGKLVAFSLVGAYFAVLFVGGLLHGHKLSVLSPDFIIYFHPLTYAVAWLCASAVLLLYGSISKPFVYGFTWLAALAYAIRTAVSGRDPAMTVAMCGVMALLTVICGRALRLDPSEEKKKRTGRIWAPSLLTAKVTVTVTAAVCGGVALLWALSTYLSFASEPGVSTGVYGQLLDSLAHGFSFDTTLEFGEKVSHLEAHLSPIFVLYLPLYLLFPSPVTLYVVQIAAVYSSVVPLWLIARRRGLSAGVSAFLCGLLSLFPAVFGGTVGSFHEYALLLPLLLWLIWALEGRKVVLPWVFAALALCVRETAAVHLFALGLYRLIANRRSLDTANGSHRRERVQGMILAAVGAVYFVGAILWLTYFGRGTLITRFANVTGEYGTFISSLLREIFINPALALYEMLSDVKAWFVLLLLLPLGLLPLFSKRRAGLVFLIPLLFLNLLADFPYHYDLAYPYAFGLTAFLFYLAVMAVPELKARMDGGRCYRRVAALALCFAAIVGAAQLAAQSAGIRYALTEQAEIDVMGQLLSTVEDDESVSASARLCPNLSGREELYTLSAEVETDVVVIDLRKEFTNMAEIQYTKIYYGERGYEIDEEVLGVGIIMRRG